MTGKNTALKRLAYKLILSVPALESRPEKESYEKHCAFFGNIASCCSFNGEGGICFERVPRGRLLAALEQH